MLYPTELQALAGYEDGFALGPAKGLRALCVLYHQDYELLWATGLARLNTRLVW